MIRLIIPTVLVVAPFWLIPKTLYVHASMTLPIFLPYVVFSHVLNKVWRRHRLGQHGLDPFLVDEHVRSPDAHIRRAYDALKILPTEVSADPVYRSVDCTIGPRQPTSSRMGVAMVSIFPYPRGHDAPAD